MKKCKCNIDVDFNVHDDAFGVGDRISFKSYEDDNQRVEGVVKKVIRGDGKRLPNSLKVTLDNGQVREIGEVDPSIWCGNGN